MTNEIPIVLQSCGYNLFGVLHQAKSSKIIIMCHGFTGNKIEKNRLFVEAAREFANKGLNVLRFDFFGSGDSEGEFQDSLVSIFVKNLQDAIIWCREKSYTKIAVLGLSLGAATAILTVANTPVDALVTWSAVPDLRRLLEGIIDSNSIDVNSREIHEYNGWVLKKAFLNDALQFDVKETFKKLRLPKLIVQGTGDGDLFVQGFREFQSIAFPPANFMEIPAADHVYQKPAHRKQVIRQTEIWFRRHF